jgi:hypothetical protein
MKEQIICSKCGKLNYSKYFMTCECKEPDFKFKTYDDYLESKNK